MKCMASVMANQKKLSPLTYHVIALISALCGVAVYLNTLDCGFCFDDLSAITKNFDLRPEAPWSNLIWNDFWGTPMNKEGSHKSYRPLCIFTFRLNYMLHELQPMGYHLVNVLLHGAVCYVFVLVCGTVVFWRWRSPHLPLLVAGLSFAVHPVHTEAVAGLVGRAECLSALLFLLSFMVYRKYILLKCHSVLTAVCTLSLSLFLCVCSVLSKEQGVTVLALCLCYEFFLVHMNTSSSLLSLLRDLAQGKVPPWFKSFLFHFLILIAFFIVIMIVRVRIMKAELPVFTVHDNPAVQESIPYRHLHWLYLIFQNVWLLLNPSFLCADWTMGTIPLIQSILDPRNVLTILTFISIFTLGLYSISNTGAHQQGVLFGLALVIFPFLPASNLLFPVGFVVAERILYVPSMGFAILVAIGVDKIMNVNSNLIRFATKFGLGFLLVSHALKTMERNRDWLTNKSLFLSAIHINSQNAKLYSNLGHEYEEMKDYSAAEIMYRSAITRQPDDIGAFINLGRILNAQQRFPEAEEAYRTAIDMMPKGKKIRVAPAHINVYFNLANLIRKDPTRYDEAYTLYKKATSMKPDFLEAYLNMGDLLLQKNETQKAKEAFLKAVASNPRYADAHYNLGTTYIKLGNVAQAEKSYRTALALDKHHLLSMYNLGMLLSEKKDENSIFEAREWFYKLTQLSPSDEKAHFQMGMLYTDLKDIPKAKVWFKKAIDIRPSYRSALYNLGFLSYNDGQWDNALEYLTLLRTYHSDHAKGMQVLGDTYMHFKRYEEAKEAYLLCLKSSPNYVVAIHNLGVAMAELGDFEEAEHLFSQTLQLDPNHQAAKKHLKGAQIQRQKQKINKKITA